jgi:hypothetical protein
MVNMSDKQSTSEPTITPPLKATRLWGYSNRIILVLATDNQLYRITGRKRFKLQKFEQPLDKILTRQELYFMRIAKELNLSREEAYNLSQEVAKADDAEFISSFSKIAEERGITPEEAYSQILEETEKETDEFLFQIEKERIAELKVLKQFQQTPT